MEHVFGNDHMVLICTQYWSNYWGRRLYRIRSNLAGRIFARFGLKGGLYPGERNSNNTRRSWRGRRGRCGGGAWGGWSRGFWALMLL